MFTIVQDKEEFSSSDGSSDGLCGNLVTRPQAKNARDSGRHQTRVRQRDQLDQPAVSAKAREQAAGNLDRQPGLPDPTGPRKRDHSISRQKISHMLHGSRSAN
jgi:hypothetical protein